MPNQENKILKYCHGYQSTKVPFRIYVDFEMIVQKFTACCNNAEESYKTKISEHTTFGFYRFVRYSCSSSTMKYIFIEEKIVWLKFVI